MAMWSEEETLQLINIMKPQCSGKAIVNSTGKKVDPKAAIVSRHGMC